MLRANVPIWLYWGILPGFSLHPNHGALHFTPSSYPNRKEVFIMPLWFLPGIWSFLWNPAESFLAESPAKIAIPGTIYSGGIEYSGIGTIVVPEWSTLPSPTDSATIQVDSRWNGRNGINLVGMSFQWEPTQISLRLQPHSHQIPTIFPPYSHHSDQNHSDPCGSNSYQDPSRFQVESK